MKGYSDNFNKQYEFISASAYKHRKATCVAIFGILFLCSGYGVPFQIGGTAVLIGCTILALGLFFVYGKISGSIKLFSIAMLFIANVLVTTVLRGDETRQFVIYSVYLIIALFLSQSVKYDFSVIYVKLMYFLALFSIIMWVGGVVLPSAIRLLPTIQNQYGQEAHTAFFSTITSSGNMALPRNQGLFWEAGAYQTFINIAVAIVLFLNRFERKRKKYIIVLTCAIVTTFSTTGYIVFCGIVLTYCFNEIIFSHSDSKVLRYIAVLMLGVILFSFLYSVLPSDARFQLFGKLTHYLDNTDKLTSTAVRVNAIEKAWRGFIAHPFLGCGTTLLEISSNTADGIMTCTPLNYFAYYGLYAGIVSNIGLYLYANTFSKHKLIVLALFVCLSLSTISENYMRDPIILTFIFLGWSASINKLPIDNTYK